MTSPPLKRSSSPAAQASAQQTQANASQDEDQDRLSLDGKTVSTSSETPATTSSPINTTDSASSPGPEDNTSKEFGKGVGMVAGATAKTAGKFAKYSSIKLQQAAGAISQKIEKSKQEKHERALQRSKSELDLQKMQMEENQQRLSAEMALRKEKEANQHQEQMLLNTPENIAARAHAQRELFKLKSAHELASDKEANRKEEADRTSAIESGRIMLDYKDREDAREHELEKTRMKQEFELQKITMEMQSKIMLEAMKQGVPLQFGAFGGTTPASIGASAPNYPALGAAHGSSDATGLREIESPDTTSNTSSAKKAGKR